MFYETLSAHYDQIFPPAAATLAFLDREFRAAGAVSILDLACGTGVYTLELARLGYDVTGTDLEPGMIEQAKEKALAAGLTASFAVGDMREPQALGLTFDGLFCIGNSLSHLLSENDLKKALASMRQVLRDQGTAVFQIVNYDRILAAGDTDLPLIERENIRFRRKYRPQSEERLIFDSLLDVKGPDGVTRQLQNSIELRPIRKARLEELLAEAGFTQIRAYGDFQGSEYSKDSQATIIVAGT